MKAIVDLNLSLSWFSGRVTGTIEIPSLAKPGIMKLAQTRQGDGKMLFFTLTIPPPGAADVVKRELTVKIGDAEPTVVELATDVVVSEEMSGNQDDVVLASLVDTDDAGNVSPAREQSWTLTDTIPPPEPGELGLTVTREV